MAVDDSSSNSGIAQNQQSVSADGFLQGLFRADGSLRSPEQLSKPVCNDPNVLGAWLEAVAPDRLEKIDNRMDDLPATREELIAHHIQKLLEEAEDRGRMLAPAPDLETPTLVTTEHQHERGPISAASMDDDLDAGSTVECPKCGETVETRSELKQLRSADEAETQIYHGTCGCTWREDD